jgi:SAM-dependent methyltransferase
MLHGLDTRELTPKRLSTDEGLDAWYPYYAGFSSRFATAALRSLELSSKALVLDPWLGSGTTALAAARLGLTPLGVDLNPFAVLLSRAKLASLADAERLVFEARRIVALASQARNPRGAVSDKDPLSRWLPAQPAGFVRRVQLLLSPELPAQCDSPALNACLLLSAAKAAVKFSSRAPGSNPTWTRPGAKRAVRVGTLSDAFLNAAESLATALRVNGCGDAIHNARFAVSDARRLPFANKSVDAIVTSPPYCTRIDYAVQTMIELAVLGVGSPDTFADLRRELMGTTMLRKDVSTHCATEWPRSVRAFLEAVKRHPTHRSEQYYFRNFQQYFDDAQLALREIARVLKPNARALVVLQTSYYKELEIDLPLLFGELAESAGLAATKVGEVPIRRVMATLNRRAQHYRSDRIYRETVLCLAPS